MLEWRGSVTLRDRPMTIYRGSVYPWRTQISTYRKKKPEPTGRTSKAYKYAGRIEGAGFCAKEGEY